MPYSNPLRYSLASLALFHRFEVLSLYPRERTSEGIVFLKLCCSALLALVDREIPKNSLLQMTDLVIFRGSGNPDQWNDMLSLQEKPVSVWGSQASRDFRAYFGVQDFCHELKRLYSPSSCTFCHDLHNEAPRSLLWCQLARWPGGTNPATASHDCETLPSFLASFIALCAISLLRWNSLYVANAWSCRRFAWIATSAHAQQLAG
jgi:hypothetical protein